MAVESGPSIAWLTHRLSLTPEDFLDDADVTAVVSDLLYDGGEGFLTDASTLPFKNDPRRENYLRTVLVACHLLHDESILQKKGKRDRILGFLTQTLPPLEKLVRAEEFVRDPDRREELARLCLQSLGWIPEGETQVQSHDRLTALDSVERERVIEKTRKAQERAAQLREEMARREAEEAASKMSRE